jgi:hypothetical protein
MAGLAGLALAACTIDYAPPDARRGETVPSADTTMVLTELRSYYRDFSARNWLAFSDHFWPGATMATRWGPALEDSLRVWTTTVPEFVAAAPTGPDSRAIFGRSMLDARIRLVGDLAQAWVTYRARVGDPGAAEEWQGIDAFTLLQHGGRWRIAALAYGRTASSP